MVIASHLLSRHADLVGLLLGLLLDEAHHLVDLALDLASQPAVKSASSISATALSPLPRAGRGQPHTRPPRTSTSFMVAGRGKPGWPGAGRQRFPYGDRVPSPGPPGRDRGRAGREGGRGYRDRGWAGMAREWPGGEAGGGVGGAGAEWGSCPGEAPGAGPRPGLARAFSPPARPNFPSPPPGQRPGLLSPAGVDSLRDSRTERAPASPNLPSPARIAPRPAPVSHPPPG